MQALGRRILPEVPPSAVSGVPGSSYRFLVGSAEEAVGAIRSQLGDAARVVAVRSVEAPGFAGFFGGTRLEVIAQIPPAPPPPAPDPDGGVRTERADEAESAGARAPAAVAVAAGASSSAEEETSAPETNRTRGLAARSTIPLSRLGSLLHRAGLSEGLIARLQETPDANNGDDRPLHHGLTEVAERIRAMAALGETSPLPSRAAFLGMPGVGRTTALCKWLSAEVFSRGRRGSVVSVEFDQPHSAEELAVFTELLDLEFSRLPPPPVGNDTFCYLDVPPLSLTRPNENARLEAYLDAHHVSGRVLVLSSLFDTALIRQACTVGVRLGCTHLVFTHLDELPQWGKLWDFLIEAPLSPLMLSTGPSLSGEWESDVVAAVLRRTFPWN